MNKKLFWVTLLIILVSFVYHDAIFIGNTIHSQGDEFESGGKIVKVIKIAEANAIFEVGGVKNIIPLGDHKNINGVDIKLENIFFVDEPEARNVNIIVKDLKTVNCGDGKCNNGETSNNCCIDCGCATDYRCEDNECIYSKPAECRHHVDCDDGNPNTIDLCLNTNPKKCGNYIESDDIVTSEPDVSEPESEDETNIIEEKIEEGEGFFSRIFSFFEKLF